MDERVRRLLEDPELIRLTEELDMAVKAALGECLMAAQIIGMVQRLEKLSGYTVVPVVNIQLNFRNEVRALGPGKETGSAASTLTPQDIDFLRGLNISIDEPPKG